MKNYDEGKRKKFKVKKERKKRNVFAASSSKAKLVRYRTRNLYGICICHLTDNYSAMVQDLVR